MKQNCIFCGKATPDNSRSKYCSMDCKGKYLRNQRKVEAEKALKQAREGTTWLNQGKGRS